MIENAKLSESKVLNENKSKIIKIKIVNIEYKRKIFVTCFSISELSNEIKSRSIKTIENYFGNCDNKVLMSKRNLLESKLEKYVPDNTHSSISKALTLSKLLEELEE